MMKTTEQQIQEKAHELITKFTFSKNDRGEYIGTLSTPLAKQCAIICCDEIIDSLKSIEDNYDDEFLGGFKTYWQQIKQAIEVL